MADPKSPLSYINIIFFIEQNCKTGECGGKKSDTELI